MTAEHVWNSLMSSVPVVVLPKVYLKAQFSPPYSSCSTLTISNDYSVIVLFAGEVSILTTACKKEDAEAAAQSVVNSILIWSQ